MTKGSIRVAIQQRVLPAYRIPFFDMLSKAIEGDVELFYGKARSQEMLHSNVTPEHAGYHIGRNIHILNGRFYLCWQSGLVDWLREFDPHILIMEANPRYPNSSSAIRWMKQNKRKLIGWGLGSPDPSGPFSALRLRSRARFIQHFDRLITYSELGAEQYAHLGFPRERIFVAPNAVTPRPQNAPPARGNSYLNDQPQVLFVGRLQERKRVDVLLKACAQVESQLTPQLHIVGDGPARPALEELAQEMYPSAKFYGALHGSGLAKLFAKADLFVLPGTGGLAVQEAMSYALPVIVGEADGTQADLVQSKNGLILEKNDPEELAERLSSILADIRSLRKMGLASYQIVRDEINLENMVSVFQTAIKEVMEG